MSNITRKIGIVGWETGDNSFGTTKAYLHYLGMFGDVRILTPSDGIHEDLDLVVMPGGRDVLPTNYGEVPGYYNSAPDPFKEHFAKVNLAQYIEKKIPVFGICLGFQMLCVHFGGSLNQNIDISTHGYSDEKSDDGRGELVNDLIFTRKFLVLEAKLLASSKNKAKKIKTCSLHHQAVENDEYFPEPLEVIAHTSDNVVEFMRHKELPIAGCQSHPEEDFNPLAIYLIQALLKQSPNLKNEDERNAVAVKD